MTLFSLFSSSVATKRRSTSQVCAAFAILLAGCGSGVRFSTVSETGAVKISGVVHGGQQVVAGATIQLYAVGASGLQSAARPLLTAPVTTDAVGSFSLTGLYTCPSTATDVYLVAAGGNPGLSSGQNNANLSMMSALGHCGDLTANSFISVNEITTVAAVYALAPYMSSYRTVGIDAASMASMDAAFATASELANAGTGVTPGPNVVAGHTVQVSKLQTLADILSACINTTGGLAGDGTPCGSLFSYSTSNTIPTDTVGAVLNIALNPVQNVRSIFGLNPAVGPFQPALTAAPADWDLSLTPSDALSITSATLPASTTGTAYSGQLRAAGGTPAYTWKLASGQLPTGLALQATTGQITGTPTTEGTSNFTVAVLDASHPTQVVSTSLSIVIAWPLAITTTALPAGVATTAYTATLQASGGATPYTWSIQSGSLPAGLSLAAGSGVISGTPTTSGTSSFTVAVTDSSLIPQKKTAAVSITIAPAPVVSNPGTTWYVRADGGTRYSANATDGQCDGQADAPYSGSGVNQHCAFNDYRYLWDDRHTYGVTKWVIAGGDTVILRGGPWRVGFDQGASSSDVWCWGGAGNFGCTNPTIPAGTPTQHTRILGENYASCSNGNVADKTKMTQIFGGFGVYTPLNIAGTQNLDVQCLEITRHSQCTLGGSPAYPAPCSRSGPVDDYDSDGIEEDSTTANVNLTDLWIHGHPGRGIKGPIGGLMTATRVDIAYNESAGWDFDDGNATAFGAGAEWHFNYSTIEWSGCYQEYPIVHTISAISCYGQSNQGYGDGVGTAPGQWLSVYIDHSVFAYNVQDGEDFGHVDGGHGTFSITNSYSYGNGGGAFKWGWGFDNIIFENNLIDANCHRMGSPIGDAPSTFNANLGDFCRSGDAFSFNFNNASRATFANNTIISYAATTFDYKCVVIDGQANCNDTVFTLRNNIIRAYANPNYDYGGHASPGGFCGASCNGSTSASTYNGNNGGLIGTINRDHNIFYGLNQSCIANTQTPDSVHGVSTNEQCVDPLFMNEPFVGGVGPVSAADTELDNFNYNLTSGSPARSAGANVPGLLKDYAGNLYGNPPSMGALEYRP